MKDKKKLSFSAHALLRFRERWPECAHMERSTICKAIENQITEAEKNDNFATSDGGLYFPITFLGTDGYAVVIKNRVTTILPEEYCPQVTSVLNKKRRGVQHVDDCPPRKDDLNCSSRSHG